MLEASGLVKAFGNLRAVDGVDLTIDAGTITG
jgi:ABC-type branched-subunit amino acid transport system ATPase component